VFIVALVAVALACNAVMFAFADSLVFSRDPYPQAARIVSLSSKVDAPERLDMPASSAVLDAWSRQRDVFAAVGAAMNKTLFLKRNGQVEQVRTEDITIGFLDVLGVTPRWGRAFIPGDESDPGAFAIIISEDLARRRFGHPGRALGQRLEATAGPLVVVGVMDRSFIYPNANYHIWRALDPVGPLTRDTFLLSMFARVSPTAPIDRLPDLLAARAPLVGAAAGLSTYSAQSRPLFAPAPRSRATMLYMLIGAALSLLLAACANVASVELAASVRRARTFAVQRALGASRGNLAAQATLEGAILVASAFVLAVGLASMLTAVLAPNLPDTLRLRSNNPVDLDGRALALMVVLAAIAWLVAALPPVLAASRSTLIAVMKMEDRSSVASRGTVRIRQALTASQVAFAVVLVAGGALYTRSYQHLLAVDKGFDSSSLFSIDWTMPRGFADDNLGLRAAQQLRQTPGVEAATMSSPPPSVGISPQRVALEIDGQPPMEPRVSLTRKGVDYDYFRVVRLPIKAGRLPEPGEPPTNVAVSERFARQFFPEGQAVGRTFRLSATDPWNTVVAVVGDFRKDRTRMPQPGDANDLLYYTFYAPKPAAPPQPAAAPAPPRVDTGNVTRFQTLTVRTNGRVAEAQLLARARDIEPRLLPIVSSVDDEYAKQSADTRMASQIVGAFSLLAFVISMAGVFGVMAFLVSGRTREIGIRMALGADPANVRRMVLKSSASMVALGAVAGLVLALAASRWIKSELFGVSATDPATYALTAAGVVAAALLATWAPARQASRVDPAITLRSE
jgi:predicted permease